MQSQIQTLTKTVICVLIICKPEMSSLNSKNELASSCRHSKKFFLNTVITPDLTNHVLSPLLECTVLHFQILISVYLNRLYPLFLVYLRLYPLLSVIVTLIRMHCSPFSNYQICISLIVSVIFLHILDCIRCFWQLPDDWFARSMKLGVANECVWTSPAPQNYLYHLWFIH